MDIDRRIGFTPHADEVKRRLDALDMLCLGCEDCRGHCAALIQMMTPGEPALARGRSR